LAHNLSFKKKQNISSLELWEGLHSLIERSLIIQEGSDLKIAPIINEYLKWANLDY